MFKNGFSRIPVADLGILNARLTKLIEQSTLEDVLKSEEFENFQKISEEFSQSVLKKITNDYTKSIIQKDAERDKIYLGFRRSIISQINSPLNEIAETAEKAKGILDRFGTGVEKLPYSKESEYLTRMLEEFKKEERICEVLNLKIWLDALKRSQYDFEELYALRRDDNVTMKEVESATEIRKELEKALKVLSQYVKALSVVNKTEKYKTLEAKFNECIIDVAKYGSKKPPTSENTEESK